MPEPKTKLTKPISKSNFKAHLCVIVTSIKTRLIHILDIHGCVSRPKLCGIELDQFGGISRRVAGVCWHSIDRFFQKQRRSALGAATLKQFPVSCLIILKHNFSFFKVSLAVFSDFLTFLIVFKSPRWVLVLFGQVYPFLSFYFSDLSSGKFVIDLYLYSAYLKALFFNA